MFEPERPAWSREGRDWPNREHSHFLPAAGMTWHIQEMGIGPRMLLLHGTGAATHSYRDLLPLLAASFHVLAPDLPGHGFTGMPTSGGLYLPSMARAVAGLIKARDFDPDIVVGHSAGAAILAEMALRGAIRPKLIVAINGALLPIRGAAVFSPLAKLLFLNPVAPQLFAWRALSRDATARLLEGTGSRIDQRGIDLYQRLFRKPGHVAGTLGMMANWNLLAMEQQIAGLSIPLALVTGAFDRAVPPRDAQIVASRCSLARVVALPYGGHLVHEERPADVAALVAEMALEAAILPKESGDLSN